jgi:SNF2 family DNA or RNA helicase
VSHRVRVRIADADSIEVIPEPEEREAVIQLLARLRPPLRARRVGSGLRLPLADADRLLDEPDATFDWDRGAARAAKNRRAVREQAPEIVARAHDVLAGGAVAARGMLEDWSFRVPLDEHQIVNIAAMTLPGGWGACVFDEQGTGKTVTTIGAFDLLVERGEADTLVLVAPKSMVAEWQREFERFMGDLYAVAVIAGTRRERAAALHSGADVLVVGYETALRHEDDVVLLAQRRNVVLTVDESYNVKNPDAQRSAALRRIREWCDRCYVLCGTPAPNRPDDLVAQFDLVDYGHTFAGYRRSGDADADRIAIRAAVEQRGIFTRNLKRQVLPDLPDRTFREVMVELAPAQARAYQGALDDLIIDLESTDERDYRRDILSFLERRAALLRICSNPSSLVPNYDETPAKLLALDGLLASILDRGDKAVVWSFYRHSLDAIADRYADRGLVRVDGTVSEIAARREAVRAFQDDDDIRIFLGNPAAAGAGITLHAARIAIYESISNQAAHWMQSLDRIHRRGQERDCEYLLLICRDTIEEDEFSRVREKGRAQADLLGDPPDPAPSRRFLLDELLRARGAIEAR